MDLTLEQEFEKRKLEVMKTVVGVVTMKAWIDQQMKGVNIPTFLIDQKELQYKASIIADNILHRLEQSNQLETAFEESWQAVAEYMT